jgi:hypothetical protein
LFERHRGSSNTGGCSHTRPICDSITVFLPAATAAATTTAASAAAITSSTAAATPASAARAAFTGTGFVDTDCTAFEFSFVKFLNRLGSIVRVGHLDEAETARLAREFIDNDYRAVDFAGLREKRFQVLIGH